MASQEDLLPAREVLHVALILAAIIVGHLTVWLFSIDAGSTGID